jgi:hypothetical protein
MPAYGAWSKVRSGTWPPVFKRSGVERAHRHCFRRTLASELTAKGVSIQDVAGILADTVATIEGHYSSGRQSAKRGRTRDCGESMARIGHRHKSWSVSVEL